MRGCLEDLVGQTLYEQGRLEIVIINSNSPENEESVIEEYIGKYPHIIYLETQERETIYEAWNRGIKSANGKYVTNANTDDRHRADALEIMAGALEFSPEIGLVYADCLVTAKENDTFEKTDSLLRYELPDFSLGAQLSVSCFGAQPMWRRSLHAMLGYFNPLWKIAGDYEFFIRVAWKAGAVHLRETLGLFLVRPDSASGADNTQNTIRETLEILRKSRSEIPLDTLYPALKLYPNNPSATAAALWDYGNLCLLSPYPDYELALSYFEKAFRTIGLTTDEQQHFHDALFNNAGIAATASGNYTQAREFFLQASARFPEAKTNAATLEQSGKSGTKLHLRVLKAVEIVHPVIEQSRMTNGLIYSEKSGYRYTPKTTQKFWESHRGIDGVNITEEERERVKKVLRIHAETGIYFTQQSTSNITSKTGGKRILLTMYGWDEEGGGTLLPKAVAEELVQRGNTVGVVYAAANNMPDKPAYYCEKRKENLIHLFGIVNRPTLFYDLLNPVREQEDPIIRRIFGEILDEFQPDVVHFHNLFNLSMSLAEETSNRTIPTVFTSHNFWFICPRLYLFDGQGKRCAGPDETGKKCAVCVGNNGGSDDYRQRLNYGISVLSEKISIHLTPSSRAKELFVTAGHHPDAIRVLRQASPVIEECIRHRKMRRPSGKFRIGYLGAVLPIKGVHTLVEAAQQLGPSEVEIHIHGSASQQYLDALQRLDKRCCAMFHGAYSYLELPEILAGLDVLVAPSLVEETGGLTAVEALAAGVPVVASRLGGLTDAVNHGVNGLLFEAGYVRELADCLNTLLTNNEYYLTLKSNAKHEKTFDTFIGELLEIYEDLVVKNT